MIDRSGNDRPVVIWVPGRCGRGHKVGAGRALAEMNSDCFPRVQRGIKNVRDLCTPCRYFAFQQGFLPFSNMFTSSRPLMRIFELAHARTHARMHARTHARRTHARTLQHARARARAHTNTLILHKPTLTHSQTHTTLTHTLTHTYRQIHSHSPTT